MVRLQCSAMKGQDLLIRNLLTWQGGRRAAYRLGAVDTPALDFQLLNVAVLTNTLSLLYV